MTRFLVGMLLSCAAWAQTAQIVTQTPRYQRGRSFLPFLDDPPPAEIFHDAPTGQSISVSELRESVPKEVEHAYQHALKLSRAGKHEKAAAELEALGQRDPKYSQVFNQLGVEYALLTRWTEAESALRRSLEVQPSSWSANYNLALILIGRGDVKGAEESARRALLLSGESPRVHLLLGEVLVLRDETRDEGITELKLAAPTMPAARQVLRNLGAREEAVK